MDDDAADIHTNIASSPRLLEGHSTSLQPRLGTVRSIKPLSSIALVLALALPLPKPPLPPWCLRCCCCCWCCGWWRCIHALGLTLLSSNSFTPLCGVISIDRTVATNSLLALRSSFNASSKLSTSDAWKSKSRRGSKYARYSATEEKALTRRSTGRRFDAAEDDDDDDKEEEDDDEEVIHDFGVADDGLDVDDVDGTVNVEAGAGEGSRLAGLPMLPPGGTFTGDERGDGGSDN